MKQMTSSPTVAKAKLWSRLLKQRHYLAWLLMLVATVWLYHGTYVWLTTNVKQEAVAIKADIKQPDLAWPVYAQFTVSQTLTLDKEVNLSDLVVPIYPPAGARDKYIIISLWQDGKQLSKWRFEPDETIQLGAVNWVTFSLSEPVLLQRGDKLEVLFDGSAIAVLAKDAAPRVFVEPADSSYSEGNARVASIDKEADVSLQLWEVEPRWQQKWRQARDEPLTTVGKIGRWLLLFLVATTGIWVLLGIPGVTDYDRES